MIEQASRRMRTWSRWWGREGGKTFNGFSFASPTFCCRALQSVWLAPDLPVSFLIFLDGVYHITLLDFVAWGKAMVAYFCQATIFQWYIGPLAL